MKRTLAAVVLVCLLAVPSFAMDVIKLSMTNGQPATLKGAFTIVGPLMGRVGIPIPASAAGLNLGIGGLFRIPVGQDNVLTLNPLITGTIRDTVKGSTPYLPITSSDNTINLCLGQVTGPEVEMKLQADCQLTAAQTDPKIIPSGYLFALQRLNGWAIGVQTDGKYDGRWGRRGLILYAGLRGDRTIGKFRCCFAWERLLSAPPTLIPIARWMWKAELKYSLS